MHGREEQNRKRCQDSGSIDCSKHSDKNGLLENPEHFLYNQNTWNNVPFHKKQKRPA